MKHATSPLKSRNAGNGMVQTLSKSLANTYLLTVKTQNYHWNVMGPDFRALHAFFEEMYNALTPNIDLLAERIRSLGAFALGSMAEMLKLSDLTEDAGHMESAQMMLTNLLTDHQQMIKQCKQGIEDAGMQHDPGTADLLTAQLRMHEKYAWMLAASVKKQSNTLRQAA